MSAAWWLLIGALALVGFGFMGFLALIAWGYWQHIRAGRKVHKAAELSDRAGE